MKQLVARAQLIVEEIGEGFDPGNALESGVGQYPKVGVEFVNGSAKRTSSVSSSARRHRSIPSPMP